MSPQGPPASGPNRPGNGPHNVNLNATASGQGRVNQAGRDQHFHITFPLVGAALVLGLLVLALWKPLQHVTAGLADDSPSASASPVVPWTPPKHVDPLPPLPPPTTRSRVPDPPDPPVTPTPSPTPRYTPPPPPPDPVDVAFAAIHSGDCLDVYNTGLGEWSRTSPVAVDCRGGSAFNRVAAVATAAASCPTGMGRDAYGHTNRDNSVTVLCLERQFRNGQCFVAATSDYRSYNGWLSVVWDCRSGRVPKSANVIMAITAVLTVRDTCPSYKGRYTAEWPVLDGSAKVCALVV